MSDRDQNEVISFLSRPETYALRGVPVTRIDTHISAVFLAGQRAYKLKRAVSFPYLDYSSLRAREAACRREVQLNRRTASWMYRGVVAVTKQPGGALALGGTGEPIDWLVEMVRFDDRLLLDRLATAGTLDVDVSRRLARVAASFHEGARPRRDHGGTASMRGVVEGNLHEMLGDASGTLDAQTTRAIYAASMAATQRHDCLLEARRMHGLVRQCHGDLHLHNVFLKDQEPVLFDAIEFNDDFACIDVLYDFAFLLMDLHYRRLGEHANAALNAYLEQRPDYRGLSLLPLFLSCRAAVRAKVSVAEAAVQADSGQAASLRVEAQKYLRLARKLLEPAPPMLLAIGGFSGSGKSTLAALLAPGLGAVPGAVILRTDVIRKQMFGVDPLHPLPQHAYDASITARVYARALHAAEACIRSGQSAVVDGVFADASHRAAIEEVARDAALPFAGVWLEVPYEVAARRIARRTTDASDATTAVLRRQMRESPGPMRWARVDGRTFRPGVPITVDAVAGACAWLS